MAGSSADEFCMKAENSGRLVNGYRGNNGNRFNRAGNNRLLGYKPQMPETHVRSMTLDQPPDWDIDTGKVQLPAARTGKIQPTALGQSHYPGVTIPNDALPGLNTIGFWDGTGPQRWGIDAHRKRGVEMHFVETGNMAFMVDDRQFGLGAGDLAVTSPWQLHQLGDPYIGPGRVHWLSLDVGVRNPNDQWRWPAWIMLTPADLAELTQKIRRNKMPVRKSTPEIARIFQQIGACVVQWKNPHSISRMIACLNQLFVSFLDMPMTPKSAERPDRNSSRRVVEVFLKGLRDSPANCEAISSLKQMSEHCGMGVTSFAKHTRELVNVGPMEFLKQCRLNHAAKQLREQPGRSITDVCFSNGFNSSQYFATCFRKQFKMPPSEFILKQRYSV
jgi:AraC family L-rhamnose operon regulatory protein RhaS